MSDIQQYNKRLMGLQQDRYSWWVAWRDIAEYILPRRYKWLVTPNQYNRGAPLNQAILDSTGTIAARTLAAGMMSGITSPTRPWFKLKIEGFEVEETNPISLWLAEVEKRMMRVFSESNFYNSMAVVYLDLAVFGTAVNIIYEDYDDVIRCYNPCAGEYYLANSDRLKVDTMYRQFVQTARQLVQWFGEENCSQDVREANKTNPNREFTVAHAIEPNDPPVEGIPKTFPYRDVYWEFGKQTEGKFLKKSGFHEFPVLAPRWDLVANDAYGRSPGMDALGDIKQLQQETKRKAQAIDKMVNPPMVADVQMKNQPASLIPGGVTYVTGLSSGTKPGFAPAYQVQFPVDHLSQDILLIQERIKNIFFNDLFMMISQLQTVRTATEIDARREEKLVMLGPVLERFENEALDPAIDRTFNIMLRAGLLPPPPEEIQGAPIQIQYVSMLAEAQSAVATSGIERVFALAGNLAAVKPDILDKIDFDEGVDEYASLLRVAPKLIRSDDAVASIRQQRQQAEAAQMGMAVTAEGVNAAKTLSETDVGAGQNALQMMTGLGGP